MALIDDLLTAASDSEILRHIARATWAKANDGDECPEKHIPKPAKLAAWLPVCPAENLSDCGALLSDVLTPTPEAAAALLGDGPWTPEGRAHAARLASALPPPECDWSRGDSGDLRARVVWRPSGTRTAADRAVSMLPSPGATVRGHLSLTLDIASVHTMWRALSTPRPRHPLAPLVNAWQQRPPTAKWDSREHPVLSGTLAGRDGGLRPLVVANDPRQLPLSLTGGSEPRQLWLGFEQPEPDRVPVLPLVAFDRRGGVSMTSGAGAAHAIRLYVEALLAVPPDRRNDGSPIPLRAKLRDVVAGLWPRGWQRGRDWPRLLAGLDELRRLGVEWEHGGTGGVWFAVTVRSMPREEAQLDDLLQFEVQLPPGSGPGPMVARKHLRLLGLESAPAYRLYLSLCWLWDYYGTVRGRLIGASPPQRRDKPVEPVEIGGHLVNPVALQRYPTLAPDHLAVMSYAPADLALEGSSTRRTQRQRAREALNRIATQTGAVVVPSPSAAPGSVQVFPPASHKAAHDGKAELWRYLNRDGSRRDAHLTTAGRSPNHGGTLT